MSWEFGSMLVLALALAVGFAWYERRKPPAKVLALVAALAALAVVGRLAFAAVPNVKPTTDIVLFAGYALGAAPGFAVGAVTAVASNFFLGQGPWTVWQMAGWGGVGVAGALTARALRRRDEPPRLLLASICAAMGLLFGAWMDVYQWTLATRQDLDTYLAVAGTSLPYNAAHAIGNFVFCLLIGPAFVRALSRYRKRFDVRWRAPALAGAVLALALLLPAAAMAATPAQRAASYLKRSQNSDGGFGAAPRLNSAHLHTGWAALGLASAKANPRDVRRSGGRSVVAYLKRRLGVLKDVGELERTVLVLRAAGLSPRRFGGRDLLAEVLRHRRGNGSFAGFVSYTAFGILALRASGEPVGRRTAGWLTRAQNDDGGFAVSPSGASDSDMTGVGLQALAAIGRSGGSAARRSVAWLRAAEQSDGGWGVSKDASSNSQSTAYAVTGLIAVGAGDGAVKRGLGYLRARQRGDGSVAYSASSAQTPVWVTAQALLAFRRAPFPLGVVPRKKRVRRSGSAAPSTAPAQGSPGAGGGKGNKSGAGAGAAEAGAEALEGGALPARPEELEQAPDPERTASLELDEDEAESGPATWLVGLSAAGAIGLVFLLRRRLRRRRAQ